LLGQFTPNLPNSYWRKVSVSRSGEPIPVFADGLWDGTDALHTDVPPAQRGYQNAGSSMTVFSIPRHEGARPVNLAFLDASVRNTGLKELWRLKWHPQFDTAYADARVAWPAWMSKYR
jgi:hypothetical protein